ILQNIELNEIPLSNIALKTSRLSRLLNDFKFQKIMEYEASGYPSTPNGADSKTYELGVLAKREYQEKDSTTQKINSYIYIQTPLNILNTSLKHLKLHYFRLVIQIFR
ncbi:MAG: hypothetical protein Q8T08_16660, partial [Ignavibacteria bacterium]|nr:hypothetical protein [Ignavibacteria bacterium]